MKGWFCLALMFGHRNFSVFFQVGYLQSTSYSTKYSTKYIYIYIYIYIYDKNLFNSNLLCMYYCFTGDDSSNHSDSSDDADSAKHSNSPNHSDSPKEKSTLATGAKSRTTTTTVHAKSQKGKGMKLVKFSFCLTSFEVIPYLVWNLTVLDAMNSSNITEWFIKIAVTELRIRPLTHWVESYVASCTWNIESVSNEESMILINEMHWLMTHRQNVRL